MGEPATGVMRGAEQTAVLNHGAPFVSQRIWGAWPLIEGGNGQARRGESAEWTTGRLDVSGHGSRLA